ncbi:MAG: hypothetical protein L0387_06870 [Acidobacteria bacterium]|nr:hypothetical protein [Acidobacteriota bacterium]MCI0621377.1 hypothetical protein [Acidobacteriota bacterium]MCI0719637.1 hypothetical protein [Acidobacteriota bacterium]
MRLARELGPYQVLNSRRKNAGALLREIGGVGVILAVTISASEISQAISGLKPDGTMVLIVVRILCRFPCMEIPCVRAPTYFQLAQAYQRSGNAAAAQEALRKYEELKDK